MTRFLTISDCLKVEGVVEVDSAMMVAAPEAHRQGRWVLGCLCFPFHQASRFSFTICSARPWGSS
jgi:hypothetical protein